MAATTAAMMAPAQAALSRFAAVAYLQPGQYARRAGMGFNAADFVYGEMLPRADQTWIAISPFETLPIRNAMEALRARMQLIEVAVRLSMTPAGDWQTKMDAKVDATLLFQWPDAWSRLMGPTGWQQRSLFTLRWGHPRFLVHVNHAIGDDFPMMLEQFLSGVTHDNESLWRQDAGFQSLLDDEKSTTFNTGASTQWRIVELGLAIHRGSVTSSLLNRIVQVLDAFGETQRRRREEAIASNAAVAIEFRVVSLWFDGAAAVASSALAELGELLVGSNDLYIREIRLAWLRDAEAHCLQKCLRDLTRPPTRTSRCEQRVDASRFTGITRLSVGTQSKSFAICGSAAREPSTLQEVDVLYAADEMATLAAWLAFGVFHVDSSSRISTVCLRMPGSPANTESRPPFAICSSAWVEIFKRVLGTVASSHDLAPTTTKRRKRKRQESLSAESSSGDVSLPSDKLTMVVLKPQTIVRAQPSGSAEIVAVVGEDDDPEQKYPVVRRFCNWVAIALPGAGSGWIPSTAATSEATCESKLPVQHPLDHPPINNRVTTFKWVGGTLPSNDELRPAHGDAIVELLSIIGGPLEVLHLPNMALRNHHVAPIVRHCPNLKELNISNNDISDITPLLAAYKSGVCKMTSLNVAQYGEINEAILEQCASIVQLCPTMKSLAVRITQADRAVFLPPLQCALQNAPELEYVRIHCDDPEDDDDFELDEVEPLVSDQAREIFLDAPKRDQRHEAPYCSRPLPLRSKLAVLSVSLHPSMKDRAMSRLDNGVLSLVLEMARTAHRSIVDITTY